MATVRNFAGLSSAKVEDDLTLSFIRGNQNDIMQRDSIDDRVNESVGNFDTESSMIFYQPIRFAIVRGSVETKWEWSAGDVSQSDIERLKELNASDYIHQESAHSETSVSDAMSLNYLKATINFIPQTNAVYTSHKWQLATKCTMKALVDDTRFLCTLTDNPNYAIEYFDILAGQSRDIGKQGTTNYLAFSGESRINDDTIAENSIKKLTSDSVNVTNTTSEAIRIVSVYK